MLCPLRTDALRHLRNCLGHLPTNFREHCMQVQCRSQASCSHFWNVVLKSFMNVCFQVIQAEDALNLNALLLSGNSSKLFSTDLTRKRMPPMTSSILMTINKCEFSVIRFGRFCTRGRHRCSFLLNLNIISICRCHI